MNTEYILEAKSRQSMGTANAKKIRRENGIPAVVYGDIDNNILYLMQMKWQSRLEILGFIAVSSNLK